MQKIKEIFATNTKEKITCLAFVIVLIILFFGMFINWKILGENFIVTYRTEVPTGAPILERITGAIDAAETAVNEGTFKRQEFVEIYGLAQLLMDKRVITDYNYGSLYKTFYDQVTFAVPERYVDDAANATFPVVNELIQHDIDFLYIQLPFKVSSGHHQDITGIKELPPHITDYSNENASAFLDIMNNANVKTYDLREDFYNSGLSQNDLFFNTDHHWTIEGAFLATDLISKYLNENYDFDIQEDLYSMSKSVNVNTDAEAIENSHTDNSSIIEDEASYIHFKKTTYKDYFLGSMGRRVGKIYGGLDDFSLITPKFPTDIKLTQIEGAGQQIFEGSFNDAVLEMQYIENADVSTNRYAVYHGDYQELRFENKLVENDKKILIIKDSFGIPIYSLLSLGIKEVRAIDLRLFEMNVADYAIEYNPDLVVLMYNADSFVDPMFDFNLNVDNEKHKAWLESLR